MHIMVDLETLDTKDSAVIVSIGAVVFDPNNPSPIFPADTFYAVLHIGPQLANGRTISGATVKWWMEQSAETQSVFKEQEVHPMSALQGFNNFCDGAEGIWGNGSDFDNAILKSANDTFGLEGWKYSRNRCFRTMNSMQQMREVQRPERAGTHHNALDDAIYQAQCLQFIVKALGIRI